MKGDTKMAHTNSTTNYGLPQWIGSDKPTFLGDFNSAFNTIDTQMKVNAGTASGAAETASSANATAISANETAVAADGKATLAKNTADAATSAAQSASDLATVAKNTADSAARTAQANNIANLAPAYDETRTYSVGDLVTYVDENNSGKLYKCIIAWNTPGAFNINYWDDVTVSEVFTKKTRFSFTRQAGVSIKDFFKNTLAPVLNKYIGTDQSKHARLKANIPTPSSDEGRWLLDLDLSVIGVTDTGSEMYNRYCFTGVETRYETSVAYILRYNMAISPHEGSNAWWNESKRSTSGANTDPGNGRPFHLQIATNDIIILTYMVDVAADEWTLEIE